MQNSSYERYSEVRNKLGYKDATVAEKTGITKSTFSDWKAGRYVPKREKMSKIADFLGTTVDYLMTGCDQVRESVAGYYQNTETAEIAQQLFENEDLRVLFDAAKDASPEDLKVTYDILMVLKKKELKNDM